MSEEKRDPKVLRVGAEKRGNAFTFDPAKLILRSEPGHDDYDPRSAIDESDPRFQRLLKQIRRVGYVIENIVVRPIPGDTICAKVIEGQQRVRCLRIINDELIAKGMKPILIVGTPERVESEGASAEMGVMLNNTRVVSTWAENAAQVRLFQKQGRSTEEIAEMFGQTPNTIRVWLRKADAAEAVAAGAKPVEPKKYEKRLPPRRDAIRLQTAMAEQGVNGEARALMNYLLTGEIDALASCPNLEAAARQATGDASGAEGGIGANGAVESAAS